MNFLFCDLLSLLRFFKYHCSWLDRAWPRGASQGHGEHHRGTVIVTGAWGLYQGHGECHRGMRITTRTEEASRRHGERHTHRGMGIVRGAWGIDIVIGVFIEGECLRHETRDDCNVNKS